MADAEQANIVDKILKVLLTSVPYLIGFTSALLVEPIRRKIFKPNLELEFKENDDCITSTPEIVSGHHNRAFYIRVRVKNASWYSAYGCRAHLVNIERSNENGQFVRTQFVDALRLAWSCQPSREEAFRPLDIPKNVSQFFDVISTRPFFRIKTGNLTFEESLRIDRYDSTYRFETQVTPLRYDNLINEAGEFRYTILVTAEGADPKFLKLIFKWTNDWQNFDVRQEN